MKTKPYTVMFLFFLIFVMSCTSEIPPEKEAPASEEIAGGSQPDFPSTPEPESISEKPQEAIPEINNVPTEPVAETWSFSWEKDTGSRMVDGSVPFVHKLKDGRVRLYYCNSKGILSAVSKDGLAF